MTVAENPAVAQRRTSLPIVHPYGVARIAAGAFDDLAALDLVDAPRAAADVRRLQHDVAEAAEGLRDELFAAIHGCEDDALRRALLAAKRDLFNGRALRVDALRPARLCQLDTYASAVAALETARRHFTATFAAELAARRALLRALASREELLKPLVLSSKVFSEQLDRYLAHDGPTTAKGLDVERSLMKYLGRMHTKTSPFSLFCHLALVSVEETASANAFEGDALATRRSELRLNNYLWIGLRPLLVAVPSVRDRLPVRANPTVRAEADGYRFLINVQNLESFQRLPPREGLDRIAALAASTPPLGQLVALVADEGIIDGSAAEVHAFLLQLLDLGFLELDVRVSGTDPDWDEALLRLLEPLRDDCPAAAEAVELIRFLRQAAGQFAAAGSRERTTILRGCGERVRAARAVLRQAAGRSEERTAVDYDEVSVSAADHEVIILDRHLLYEDSALEAPLHLDRRAIEAAVTSLARAAADVSFNTHLVGERLQMCCYFEEKYGPGRSVPFLRFYEDFYRDWKVPAAKAAKRSAEEAPPPPHVGEELYRARLARNIAMVERWTKHLAERIAGRVTAGRIDILPSDVDDAFAAVPEMPRLTPASQSAFVQWVREGDALLAVPNVLSPGFGKGMSRFVHLFDPAVAEWQRRSNRALFAGRCVAELRDASAHNANLHPPLLDYEITTPGAQTSYPPEQQVAVTDLEVTLEGDELRLTRASTGQAVDVIDLGIQSPQGRAPMFRMLLYGFDRATFANLGPLLKAATLAWESVHGAAEDGQIVPQPRVIYDNRVVLRRRNWSVPAALLPKRPRGEPDHAYFARVDDWREQHGIPDYLFAVIDRAVREKRAPRAVRDDYKPQFLSLRNWFSVALFEKMIERVQSAMAIEELLPAPGDMLGVGSARHAAELIVQWEWSRA